MTVPARATTTSLATRSYSSLVLNVAPAELLEETPSMMRTNRTVPAGTVTLTGAGAAAGAAAGAGAAGATLMFLICANSMICMPELVSKRTVSAVPPRSTVPSLSSSVSPRAVAPKRQSIIDRRKVGFFMR